MVTFSPYFLFREMEMASTSAKSELGQAAKQSGSIDKVVEVTGAGLFLSDEWQRISRDASAADSS